MWQENRRLRWTVESCVLAVVALIVPSCVFLRAIIPVSWNAPPHVNPHVRLGIGLVMGPDVLSPYDTEQGFKKDQNRVDEDAAPDYRLSVGLPQGIEGGFQYYGGYSRGEIDDCDRNQGYRIWVKKELHRRGGLAASAGFRGGIFTSDYRIECKQVRSSAGGFSIETPVLVGVQKLWGLPGKSENLALLGFHAYTGVSPLLGRVSLELEDSERAQPGGRNFFGVAGPLIGVGTHLGIFALNLEGSPVAMVWPVANVLPAISVTLQVSFEQVPAKRETAIVPADDARTGNPSHPLRTAPGWVESERGR